MSLKTIIQLSGGLGNQLFQYASSYGLARKWGSELVIDDWSGFVRDKEYKRKFQLSGLPLDARKAKNIEKVPLWIFRLMHKRPKPKKIVVNTCYGNFIVENENTNIHDLPNRIKENTWLIGYFQSPLYFENNLNQIKKQLMPIPPLNKKVLLLGEMLEKKNSIAIGYRCYEEAKNPEFHAFKKKIKYLSDFNRPLQKLLHEKPLAQCAFFCTHKPKDIHKITLPKNTLFITPENGFQDPWESLWLLSKCKSHIFNNSSFFWWGAAFSNLRYGGMGQKIYVSDNFLNQKIYPQEWIKF